MSNVVAQSELIEVVFVSAVVAQSELIEVLFVSLCPIGTIQS